MRFVLNPGLLKRKEMARNKFNQPLFKCKNLHCDNLTTSKNCMFCYKKGNRGQLTRSRAQRNKRKNVGVSI